MKITNVTVKAFRTHADRWDMGHAMPLPKAEIRQTITSIETDEGVTGHYLGGAFHGIDTEGLTISDAEMLNGRIRAMLLGQDPFDREMIWKWMWVANIQENVASVIDNCLWDLAGRAHNAPVHKLMGGARDRVKAYASTYPNIGKPQAYADHALQCIA